MKSVLKGFGDVSQTSNSGDLRVCGNLLKTHQGTLDALLAKYVPLNLPISFAEFVTLLKPKAKR